MSSIYGIQPLKLSEIYAKQKCMKNYLSRLTRHWTHVKGRTIDLIKGILFSISTAIYLKKLFFNFKEHSNFSAWIDSHDLKFFNSYFHYFCICRKENKRKVSFRMPDHEIHETSKKFLHIHYLNNHFKFT